MAQVNSDQTFFRNALAWHGIQAIPPRFTIAEQIESKSIPVKLTAAARRRMNDSLYEISRARHDGIPLDKISAAVAPYRIEDSIFCGRSGRCALELFAGNPESAPMIQNDIILSWDKSELTGTFEINAYVS